MIMRYPYPEQYQDDISSEHGFNICVIKILNLIQTCIEVSVHNLQKLVGVKTFTLSIYCIRLRIS